MILNLLVGIDKQAYIAGNDDGIVTANGKPVAKDIIVLDANDLSVQQRTGSLSNGRYLITGLDPSKEYLIMCRDHERQFEPFCWDYVRPATDLSLDEQLALWQSWQS